MSPFKYGHLNMETFLHTFETLLKGAKGEQRLRSSLT